MKRELYIVLLVLFSNSAVNSQIKIENMELNDTWFGVESSMNSNPVILRGRDNLKDLKNSGNYPHLVELTWKFESPTDKGIPTPEENILMREFEDVLIESLEYDLQSILTMVHTANNERTWIFYTKSASEFGNRLNQTLSTYKKVPIEIETEEDTDWELYSGILKKHQVQIK